MSTPMTASQIKAQLRKWDVPFKEYKSWSTHNRGNRGTGWGPVNGFMVHHTGSDGADQRSFLYNGSSALPGPLCHFNIDKNGTVNLIGWGRANHAGGGDPNVFNKVVSENYSGILKPHYHEGESGAMDGNSRFYGVEISYSGSHGMSAAQYNSLLKLGAAICDFHGWSAKSVIAHGEWSDWKWDPGYAPSKMMDMNAVRNDISDTLNHKTKPVEDKPVSDPVEKKSANYKDVWESDSAEPPAGHKTAANPTWWPMSILKGAYEMAEKAFKNTEEIIKRLDALEKKVK